MTAVATATMRGQALDIRSIPGWQTAPRIWRTIGPEMRVRVICPRWIERTKLAIAIKAEKARVQREIAERRQDGWMDVVGSVAAKHGIKTDALFMAGKLNSQITAARFECFATLRVQGKRICEIGRFFGLDHSTVAHGIQRHIERNREVAA